MSNTGNYVSASQTQSQSHSQPNANAKAYLRRGRAISAARRTRTRTRTRRCTRRERRSEGAHHVFEDERERVLRVHDIVQRDDVGVLELLEQRDLADRRARRALLVLQSDLRDRHVL